MNADPGSVPIAVSEAKFPVILAETTSTGAREVSAAGGAAAVLSNAPMVAITGYELTVEPGR